MKSKSWTTSLDPLEGAVRTVEYVFPPAERPTVYGLPSAKRFRIR